LAAVGNDISKWGFIDKTGKAVIPCQWEFAEQFSEGLAAVKDNSGKWYGKWGFIDKTGKVVIPCQWWNAKSFSEGLAAVQDVHSEKWGFIDKTGKVVIPCQWKSAFPFFGGFAKVGVTKRNHRIIDKTGKIIEETGR
jgi:hypothetical protein